MSQLQNQGGLSTDVESCLDVPILARAVFDSGRASPMRMPNKTLLIHALAREHSDRGVLAKRRLIWLDTQDALPDGRPEDAAERESEDYRPHAASDEDEWLLQDSEPVHSDEHIPPNTVEGSMTTPKLQDRPLSEAPLLPPMPSDQAHSRAELRFLRQHIFLARKPDLCAFTHFSRTVTERRALEDSTRVKR